MSDRQTIWLVGGVVALLVLATVIGQVLRQTAKTDQARKVVDNLNARIWAWWIIVVIFGAALFLGLIGTIVLFALMSFIALREFITLTPSKARRSSRALLGLLHHPANSILSDRAAMVRNV